MRKISMTNQIMLATILGIFIGVLFGENITEVKIIGDIFLRLIQMPIILLIMTAVIKAVGNLNPKDLGKLGTKTFSLFLVSSVIAAFFGVGFALWIKPGLNLNIPIPNETINSVANSSWSDMLLEFFPTNIVGSMAEGNMIQVILFSILFGLAISTNKKRETIQTVVKFIDELNQVIIQLVTLVMKLAPIGIFALMAGVTGEIGIEVLIPLTKFLLTFGIASLLFLLLWFIVVSIYTKISVFELVKKSWNVMLVAFTTTSSAITLPVAMDNAKRNLGISEKVTDLVLPLGLALNSNGLAMFLSISSITFSQIYNVETSFATIIQSILLCTLATLGTVVVPGGGLVALTVVVPALGFPLESVALLAGIDWFSGMFRTLLNVMGDTSTALVVAKSEGEINYDILRAD
ncbi:dicarboxylate/amino acid:cation symporter [Enterococcus sp. 5H]|uniref:dicarboxylate/amino acid:cation symporter n=1 Tax=Enterococcus sp. 5H TaxID=1229490 RepID=UPI002303793A|nr:dicarboxylate/amino acid:cation symporter [Enterococcus sp. 5H]MDA9471147.1 sodium, dicarboxylate symporter family protein [Enterococcus sp. 5H]